MTTRRCAQARRLPIVGLILPLALAASPAPLPSGDPAQAPLLSGVPEDVAALLEPIRSRHRLPALAGAVLLGDTLVALGATGVRKRGADVAVTTSDLWLSVLNIRPR